MFQEQVFGYVRNHPRVVVVVVSGGGGGVSFRLLPASDGQTMAKIDVCVCMCVCVCVCV